MRVFFNRELDTAATFWRIFRTDGIALGFTSHDQDLYFSGMRHRAAPGMVPTAIRMTSDLSEDSAGVEGALTHNSINPQDLAAGLFDDAVIDIGIVSWEDGEHDILYSGTLGQIEDDSFGFSAELHSFKRLLESDLVPRTSPTCRAVFCGPGCGLSASKFTSCVTVETVDFESNRVMLTDTVDHRFSNGQLRFLDGPQTGLKFGILDVTEGWLSLDRPLQLGTAYGTKVELIEGCDHTVLTCANRFSNSVNFRGEPFLPGNDLLARYGSNAG